MTAQRDSHGRFVPGNSYAATGGKARAEALTPERRQAIAAQGFETLAVIHFNGDKNAAKTWLVRHGTLAGLFGNEYARREYPLPQAE